MSCHFLPVQAGAERADWAELSGVSCAMCVRFMGRRQSGANWASLWPRPVSGGAEERLFGGGGDRASKKASQSPVDRVRDKQLEPALSFHPPAATNNVRETNFAHFTTAPPPNVSAAGCGAAEAAAR